LVTETILDPSKVGYTATDFNPGLGIQGWSAKGSAPGDSLSLATGAPKSTQSGDWETAGATTLDATHVMPGSDIFRIWRADNPLQFEIHSNSNAANPKIKLLGTASIPENSLIVLSDCVNLLLIARACKTKPDGANTEVDITPSCGNDPPGHVDLNTLKKPAEAMLLTSYIYYVGKRANAASNPPALFRRPLGNDGKAGTPEELIEGVENMQVLYGIDTNGDNEVDRGADGKPVYLSAESVPDWQQVISVQVALLLASADNVRTEPDTTTYDLLGVEVKPPADRRLRRILTTTVALRNRIL
jgi:type IV pilus assembly protein PilW